MNQTQGEDLGPIIMSDNDKIEHQSYWLSKENNHLAQNFSKVTYAAILEYKLKANILHFKVALKLNNFLIGDMKWKSSLSLPKF